MAHEAKLRQPFRRRLFGVLLSAAMVGSVFTGLGTVGRVITSTPVKAAAIEYDYDLMDATQEGVILHAWQWSFNNIKEYMPAIAQAGYTSVQTSVIQRAKESTFGKTNDNWWVYYQPSEFHISDGENYSALGTKAEFQAMCEEAHKYGIHVIVDIVANHLGNQKSNDKSTAIPAEIRNNSAYWHTNWNVNMNGNIREQSINYSLNGLPDLNTENADIQQYVIDYMKECIDAGADGFRFDTAKHIGNEADGSQYTFWKNVIPAAKAYYAEHGNYASGLYCYGECLGFPQSGSYEDNEALLNAYFKYINLTDDSVGNDLLTKVVSGSSEGAKEEINFYDKRNPSQSVLWAESHDTYSGDDQLTTNVSVEDINKAWALLASRGKSTALYFARTGDNETTYIGDVGTFDWKASDVVQVNKFHNYFNGQSDYISEQDGIVYNMRGSTGVVLVNISGSSSVNVSVMDFGGTKQIMADGTYIDQISGNTFTVANGKISGQMDSSGIAVVYNPEEQVYVKTAPEDGGFTDTLDVMLKAKHMTNTTYYTSEGDAGSFVSGDVITIGQVASEDTVITVTVQGQNESGETVTNKYQYYKQPADAAVTLYFDNSSYGWSQVNAYVYDGDAKNGSWPGQRMTYNSTTGLYEYELPDTLVNGYVLFTEKNNSTTNRYPADGDPGLAINGVSKVFGADYSFEPYIPSVEELTVTVDQEAIEAKVGESITVQASAAGGYSSYGYEMYYQPDGSDSGDKVAESTDGTLTYTPAEEQKGTLRIVATDSHQQQAWTDIPLTVEEEEKLTVTVDTDAIESKTGETITVQASAAGGDGNYHYRMDYLSNNDSTWKTVAESTDGTLTYLPRTVHNGTLRVIAVDGQGLQGWTDIPLTVTLSEMTLSVTGSDEDNLIMLGETVKVVGKLKGGITGREFTAKLRYFNLSYLEEDETLPTSSLLQTADSNTIVEGEQRTLSFIPNEAGTYYLVYELYSNDVRVLAERLPDLEVRLPQVTLTASSGAETVRQNESVTVTGTMTAEEPAENCHYEVELRTHYPDGREMVVANEGWMSSGDTVSLDFSPDYYYDPGTVTLIYRVKYVTMYGVESTVAEQSFPLVIKGQKPLLTGTSVEDTTIILGDTVQINGRFDNFDGGTYQVRMLVYCPTEYSLEEEYLVYEDALTSTGEFSFAYTPEQAGDHAVFCQLLEDDGEVIDQSYISDVSVAEKLTVSAEEKWIAAYVGDKKWVGCTVTGGYTPYTYDFIFLPANSTEEVLLQSGGSASYQYCFNEPAEGTLRYQVTDIEGNTAYADVLVKVYAYPTLNVAVSDEAPLGGDTVTFTATLSGEVMPTAMPYKAYLISAENYTDTNWWPSSSDLSADFDYGNHQAVLDYTAGTLAGTANTDELCLVVWDEDKTTVVAKQSVTLTVGASIKLTTVNGEAPVEKYTFLKGTDASLTLDAEGGFGDYTYELQTKEGTDWKTQKTAEGSVMTLDTDKVERVAYRLKIVDSKEKVGYAFFDVVVVNELTSVYTIESKNDLAVGDVFTFDAAVDGGSGQYEYRVWVKDNGQEHPVWDTESYPYQQDSTFSFTFDRMTRYTLRIQAIDTLTKRYVVRFADVRPKMLSFVHLQYTDESKKKLAVQKITLGKTFSIDALAQDGYGGYQYRLDVKKDGQWLKGTLGSDSQLTFTPEETGRYSLRLWVQDARPEKPYTLCAYVDVIVDPAELAFKNTFNKRDYALVDEELTFDAELTGGVAPYTYSLEVKDDSNAWKSIVENSTDSKLTWKPDVPGRYSLRIVAADQRGWTQRYYPDVTVEKALVFEEMPQKTNRTAITSAVSFEAAVSGGFSNSYTFTLERKNVNENGEYTWDLIDTQVSNNGAAQFVFQPSEVTTYVFRLAARDAHRKAAYVYFTLQVDEDADILG